MKAQAPPEVRIDPARGSPHHEPLAVHHGGFEQGRRSILDLLSFFRLLTLTRCMRVALFGKTAILHSNLYAITGIERFPSRTRHVLSHCVGYNLK